MSRVQIPNIGCSRVAHGDSGKCVVEWTVVPLTFSQLEICVALHAQICALLLMYRTIATTFLRPQGSCTNCTDLEWILAHEDVQTAEGYMGF